jgi:hypothetical protein
MENVLDEQLDEARRRYTSVPPDPMAPWQAYHAARAYGRDVPAWVLEYFDRVADVIIGEIRGRNPRPEPAALYGLLAEALMFKGRREHAITSLADRDRRVAEDVRRAVDQGTKVPNAVREVAAARGISESTVERAWRRSPLRVPDNVRTWLEHYTLLEQLDLLFGTTSRVRDFGATVGLTKTETLQLKRLVKARARRKGLTPS